MISGCAPRYRKLDDVGSGGFVGYRNLASGNAVVEEVTEPPDTLLYEIKLNGGIGAQAVVNDRLLVVPTFNKRIYFLDPANGREITSLVTESSVPAAVALVDELIYFAEESDGNLLTCFNLVNGKMVWEFELFDPRGAPVVIGEEVYIASRRGTLYRLNRWRGDTEWKHQLAGQVYAPPAVNGDLVCVGNDQGTLTALDRAEGEVVWESELGAAVLASPMISDLVYCGAANGSMFACDRETGEQVWSFETAGQIQTTPVTTAGLLVFGSNDQTLYCLNADTGDLLWSTAVDGIVKSSPIVIGDFIACASAAGEVNIFDFDGRLVERFEVDGIVSAPPAYSNGKLFVTTRDRRLYCFGN
jgi:outer membrane protein assembly factor BamB